MAERREKAPVNLPALTALQSLRNAHQLTRDDQLQFEQPGCVHVTMDLYRLAFRLVPFVESTIVLDAFELALDARRVDMRASPYDVTDLGLDPIPVETSDGKAAYVQEQRRLAALAAPLRERLLHHVSDLLEHGSVPSGA